MEIDSKLEKTAKELSELWGAMYVERDEADEAGFFLAQKEFTEKMEELYALVRRLKWKQARKAEERKGVIGRENN